MAATHAKELADLARAKSEEAIAPVAALVRQDKPVLIEPEPGRRAGRRHLNPQQMLCPGEWREEP